MKYSYDELRLCIGMICFFKRTLLNREWNYSGEIIGVWVNANYPGDYGVSVKGASSVVFIDEIQDIPIFEKLRNKPLLKILKLA